MKTSMPFLNMSFSLLESAALILMVPVLVFAVAGLVGATVLLRRKLRSMGNRPERAQLWIREFQRGA